MKQALSQKIETFIELLHYSALSEGVKETIIDNIGKVTEAQLDDMIISLEREKIELEELKDLLEEHETGKEKQARQIGEETRQVVQKHIDEFVLTLSSD
jgi:hypothetical protein